MNDQQRAAMQAVFDKANAVEIDSDECLDFDECTAMLVPLDSYNELIEAITALREALTQPQNQSHCKRCNGTGVIPDGVLTFADGVELESEIQCVTDCPDCTKAQPQEKMPTQGGHESRFHKLESANCTTQPQDSEFKNFHRLLCERFGYTHDDKDWKRDQLSLIEWIAKQTQPPKVNEFGEELCEDEGCPHHGTVHYCKGMNMKQTNNLLSVLEEINTLACYASEEAIETRESTLLRIGEIARSALAQPQGEWVGLTATEIDSIIDTSESDRKWLVREAIAKFKEKNTPPVVPQGESVADALRHAAQIVELYDDATMTGDYMIDSTDCAGILNALAEYHARFYTTPPSVEAAIEATKEATKERAARICDVVLGDNEVSAVIRSMK